MKFWGDAVHMDKPDEFEVMVVRADDCIWQTYEVYKTRSEAQEAVSSMKPSKYRLAAIKPQISALRPFQTHEMQEVMVGK